MIRTFDYAKIFLAVLLQIYGSPPKMVQLPLAPLTSFKAEMPTDRFIDAAGGVLRLKAENHKNYFARKLKNDYDGLLMIAAIYAGGELYTGTHHGDAYSKVPDKETDLLSGFVDPLTLKFIADNEQFYLKRIIMIRHGDSKGESISELGYKQANRIASFLHEMDLKDYQNFCSPIRRCVQTALVIKKSFQINDALCRQSETEEQFLARINTLLDFLPEKSLLVSHSDVIKNVTYLTSGKMLEYVPNCSITFIKNKEIVWLAKEIT